MGHVSCTFIICVPPPHLSPLSHFISLSLLPPDKWSPALQIRTVLLSIQALLSAPNPDDPLANDVAEQWKTNESRAIETGTPIKLLAVYYCTKA